MLVCSTAMAGVNYEEAPINYSASTPENRITTLQRQLAEGKIKLRFEQVGGYVPSLLKELDIPVSSQVLVFSKTSLQDHCIGPKSPRAIYFNDDIFVGFVQEGMIEIAITDPRLGKVFYTMDQDSQSSPEFRRRTNNCLNCHGGARTKNVPGLLVRSVHPDPGGRPVVAAGSFLTTHASLLSQRWGGWYVTGTHGRQSHLGNFTLPDSRKPKTIDNGAGQNVIDLKDRFDVGRYLTPHSDLVSLMVLEHQSETHNLITTVNFETRYALHQQANEVQAAKTVDDDVVRGEVIRQMEKTIEAVVRQLLFQAEAPLSDSVAGTSRFSREFSARGPRDRQGRSLREFDLTRRMFRYPCSYLVYSEAFQALPEVARSAIYRRIGQILTANDLPDDFAHLSSVDRAAIHEILIDTIAEYRAIDSRTADHPRAP